MNRDNYQIWTAKNRQCPQGNCALVNTGWSYPFFVKILVREKDLSHLVNCFLALPICSLGVYVSTLLFWRFFFEKFHGQLSRCLILFCRFCRICPISGSRFFAKMSIFQIKRKKKVKFLQTPKFLKISSLQPFDLIVSLFSNL